MKAIINGTLGPIRQQKRIIYDPQRGRVVEQQYTSAGYGLAGLALECENNGIAYDLIENPVRSRLSMTATGATSGVAESYVDTWQLLANEMQNDVKGAPAFVALGRVEIGLISEDAEAVLRHEDINDAYYIANPTSNALLNMLVIGQAHYGVGQYVLKHTVSVPNNYTGLSSSAGEESIYTTAQLLSEIGSGWFFNCPARLRNKIGDVGTGGAASDGFMWGWRKLPSTETTSANNRVDISFEYSFDKWSTYLYPAL